MLETILNETGDAAEKDLSRKRAQQDAAQHEAEGVAPLPPIIDPPLPPEETPTPNPATDLPLPAAPVQPGDVPQDMPDPVRGRD